MNLLCTDWVCLLQMNYSSNSELIQFHCAHSRGLLHMFTQTSPPGLLYHRPDTILNYEEYSSICTIKIIFIVLYYFGAAADEYYFYDGWYCNEWVN